MSALVEYINKDKEIMHEAVQLAHDYSEHNDIEKAKKVVFLLLESKIVKYKRRIEEDRIKLPGANLFVRSKLKREIDDLTNRIKELERIKGIDFDNNPYIKGQLSNHYAVIYEDIDRNIYTLFNEVTPYYTNCIKDNDKDRKAIRDRLFKFENKVMAPRREVYKREKKSIDESLGILFDEVSSMYPKVELLSTSINDVKKLYSSKAEHYRYIDNITLNHSPRYEHTSVNLPNGFAINAINNSSGLIKSELLKIGRDKVQERIVPLGFRISRIKDLIERREELTELHELLERAIFSLERNNNVVVASDNKTVNYDDAIEYGRYFVTYCEELIEKYTTELESERYSELIDKINELGKTNEIQSKFHAVETHEEKHEELSVEEENNRKIEELALSEEVLQLSCDDLYMLGIIDTCVLSELTPTDITKVIDHVNDLRSIKDLSDEEKARARATWPRIEFGEYIVPQDVTDSEIQVQRLRDRSNGRNIYERINNLFNEGPKL